MIPRSTRTALAKLRAARRAQAAAEAAVRRTIPDALFTQIVIYGRNATIPKVHRPALRALGFDL